jgi:single-strand DNA-binding protein
LAALNKVILIGRLTHDPELRYTPNGQPVANFSLAVDRKLSKNDETDFIPVVAWRRLAEICNEFLHKGKLVAIEGRLQVRSYEDKEGRRQRAFEVVADEMQMLDRSSGPGGNPGGGGGERGGERSNSGSRTTRPAMAGSTARAGGGDYDDGDSGGGGGGGFPPSDDLGIDDIPF